MEFRLLGAVGLRIDGREVPVGGPKQRALLALLLLDANRVVSRDRLIDGLWGERPPASAEHTLDGAVSRLRKLVGPDRLIREGQGYRLVVEPGELDLARVEELAQAGAAALAAGNMASAAAQLSDALAAWRDPLPDVLGEPFAAEAARELDERRLVATEQRFDAELALGGGGELVPQLDALVRAEPFRERPVGQLALALHRGGRSADALAVLAAARARFNSELGLNLSPPLRELEQRILGHDPGLAPPPPASAPRRRRRTILAVTGVAVLAVVGIAAAGLTRSHRHGAQPPATTGLLAAARGGAKVTLPGAPGALAATSDALWLAETDAKEVLRVDPSAGSVVDRIQLRGAPQAVATGGGSVWVATSQPGGVERIDATTDTVAQTITLGVNPVALAYTARRVWVADSSDQSLIELDPRTGNAVRTVALTSHPSSLVIDGTTAWVTSHDDGTLTQVDLRTAVPVATTTVGTGASAVTVAAGSVWIANGLAGTLVRVDPASLAVVTTLATGSGPSAVTSAGGAIWVANEYSRTLSRIDPHHNAIAGTIPLSGQPVSLAALRGVVWSAQAPATARRGGTMVLVSQGSFTSMDPQIEYQVPPPQLHGLAYDALVTFNHTAGSQGLQIVPDLALSVPAPTDGGRTYALRLRVGLHYSDGRAVHASDVRRSFERLYRVRSPVAPAFLGINGAPRCSAAACDLTRGISIDDTRRTVVFHLSHPDPEFLFKLAFVFTAPVPPGTPWTEQKTKPYPGTGPYRIAEATPNEVRLVRNRHFHEWSRAAQPLGNPDEIVWRFGMSPASEIRAVESGRAAWMWDNLSGSQVAAASHDHAAELHASPGPETDFVDLNTTHAPFDDVRVRRALNFAIDRSHIVALYGGAARGTCQVLPPGVPGFRPYCPYTYDPARARRLIRAAHAVGTAVRLVAFRDDSTVSRSVVLYLRGVLRQLGLKPRLIWTTHAAYTDALRPDLQPVGWYADYPAASDFFGLFFACDGAYNGGRVCDSALDRSIRVASAAEAIDPQRATRLWTAVDRHAVDQALSLPLANPTFYDLVAPGLRGYQRHLLWGFLADQAELR